MAQRSGAQFEPEPIEREVLSARVKDRILRWILEGELAPGSRIVETRVARQLGTSQAPVREALRDLATLGFVEIRPYQGSRVRQPTAGELREAIAVRAELEGLAGRLAAPRIKAATLRQLEDLFEKMARAAQRGDAHEQAVHNTRFHTIIVRAAGNRALERIWAMLEPFGRTYVTASMPGVDLGWLGERHREIIEALRNHDSNRAAQALRQHAVEAASLIAELSDEQPIPPGGGGPPGGLPI
jgi:DNA-binding GntR family transcriptional regulator